VSNPDDRDADREWLDRMVQLEEERGGIVPGGAQGGAVARARKAREAAQQPDEATKEKES
jgi:hypothetical protein